MNEEYEYRKLISSKKIDKGLTRSEAVKSLGFHELRYMEAIAKLNPGYEVVFRGEERHTELVVKTKPEPIAAKSETMPTHKQLSAKVNKNCAKWKRFSLPLVLRETTCFGRFSMLASI